MSIRLFEPANVDFSTDSAGRHHAKLLVSLIAISDRDLPKGKKPDAPEQTSAMYVVNLDEAAFRKLLTSGMPMHQQMRLTPGSYRLRLGVIDINNHRMGTLDMPVEVAAATNSP